MRIVQTNDAAAICTRAGYPGSVACALWKDHDSVSIDHGQSVKACKIYITPIDYNSSTPWILGHELKHCFDGNYH